MTPERLSRFSSSPRKRDLATLITVSSSLRFHRQSGRNPDFATAVKIFKDHWNAPVTSFLQETVSIEFEKVSQTVIDAGTGHLCDNYPGVLSPTFESWVWTIQRWSLVSLLWVTSVVNENSTQHTSSNLMSRHYEVIKVHYHLVVILPDAWRGMRAEETSRECSVLEEWGGFTWSSRWTGFISLVAHQAGTVWNFQSSNWASLKFHVHCRTSSVLELEVFFDFVGHFWMLQNPRLHRRLSSKISATAVRNLLRFYVGGSCPCFPGARGNKFIYSPGTGNLPSSGNVRENRTRNFPEWTSFELTRGLQHHTDEPPRRDEVPENFNF